MIGMALHLSQTIFSNLTQTRDTLYTNSYRTHLPDDVHVAMESLEDIDKIMHTVCIDCT